MTDSVFTIGYAQATPATLVAALKAAGIERLIDVRGLPNSRRPGFSKRMLAAALGEAGIEYRHLGALGTPKAGREANRRGAMEVYRRILDAHLAEVPAQMALIECGELAREKPSCLLCLEADPAHCHRSVVAEHLAREHGLAIVHLHPE